MTAPAVTPLRRPRRLRWRSITSVRRLARVLPFGVLLALAACGDVPDSTEKARGVYGGVNVVLALTISLVVVAGAVVVGALAFDRFVRSRRELAMAPPAVEEEEEEQEVVGGIGVGRGAVPRWLYGFYVIIPLFALLYVFNNVALRPPPSKKPAASAKPVGPVDKATIVAKQIKFDVSELELVAGTKVSVSFDNADAGVPHNFTIWKTKDDAESGDKGKRVAFTPDITGPGKGDVSWTTPASGSLYFDCTIHPTSMFGDITLTKK